MQFLLKNNRVLILILVIGFAVRFSISFGDVFSGGFINFVGYDSYYHADMMRQQLNVFPHLSGSFYDWLVVCIAWLFTAGHAGVRTLEIVSLFIPPLMAVGVIFFVYIIASRIFSRTSGLIAAAAIAIIPGEFLSRSLFGAIDHHAAEVFFTTGAAMFVILFFSLRKRTWLKYSLCIAGAAGFVAAYYYSWFGVRQAVDIAGSLSVSAIQPVQPAATQITTIEAVHPWESSNYIPLINCALALAFIIIMFTRFKGWVKYLLIAWTGFMLAATVWQMRFDYYLIVPVSIILGWFLNRQFKFNIKLVAALSFAVVFCTTTYIGIIRSDLDTPSNEWNESLVWLKENTPADATVLSWWDQGYWIRYRAERTAYITGGQESARIKDIALYFLSYETIEPPDNIVYLVIDKDMAENYYRSMSIWAGLDIRIINKSDTFINRLYNGTPDNYKLLHDGNVKVYSYEDIL